MSKRITKHTPRDLEKTKELDLYELDVIEYKESVLLTNRGDSRGPFFAVVDKEDLKPRCPVCGAVGENHQRYEKTYKDCIQTEDGQYIECLVKHYFVKYICYGHKPNSLFSREYDFADSNYNVTRRLENRILDLAMKKSVSIVPFVVNNILTKQSTAEIVNRWVEEADNARGGFPDTGKLIVMSCTRDSEGYAYIASDSFEGLKILDVIYFSTSSDIVEELRKFDLSKVNIILSDVNPTIREAVHGYVSENINVVIDVTSLKEWIEYEIMQNLKKYAKQIGITLKNDLVAVASRPEGSWLANQREEVLSKRPKLSKFYNHINLLREILNSNAELEEQEEREREDRNDKFLQEMVNAGKHKNLTFFAFTATPRDKTLEIFGDEDSEGKFHPFHIYSMKQAIQERFIMDVLANYTTYKTCYNIAQKDSDENPEVPTSKASKGRKVDPTFYPVIFGADPEDDWTDPEVWRKANPSLDITIGIDKVQAACDSAKQNPGEENAFRQLRLNQWVKQAVRWMPMEKWDACVSHIDEEDLEGRVCYGGLDLSSTTDLTSFVLVFPPLDEDDKYIVLPYFWVPEETLDLRVRRDHVPYNLWEREGHLFTTEGNVVHYGYIEKFIEKLGERFNIREIAFDRWGAVQMVQNLEGMGFTVVPMGQGFASMSPPTKELMKLTLEKKIAHSGHPVLRWNMDNIFIRQDPAGNIKADKAKSTEKIDGAIATIMALDRAIRCGNDTSESVYDTRGLLVF